MTPGFYYDTYALLNMAQSPGQVRKVAALDSEGEEAENLKKHFPEEVNRSWKIKSRQN